MRLGSMSVPFNPVGPLRGVAGDLARAECPSRMRSSPGRFAVPENVIGRSGAEAGRPSRGGVPTADIVEGTWHEAHRPG